MCQFWHSQGEVRAKICSIFLDVNVATVDIQQFELSDGAFIADVGFRVVVNQPLSFCQLNDEEKKTVRQLKDNYHRLSDGSVRLCELKKQFCRKKNNSRASVKGPQKEIWVV